MDSRMSTSARWAVAICMLPVQEGLNPEGTVFPGPNDVAVLIFRDTGTKREKEWEMASFRAGLILMH
jgi:hypothetical protein